MVSVHLWFVKIAKYGKKNICFTYKNNDWDSEEGVNWNSFGIIVPLSHRIFFNEESLLDYLSSMYLSTVGPHLVSSTPLSFKGLYRYGDYLHLFSSWKFFNSLFFAESKMFVYYISWNSRLPVIRLRYFHELFFLEENFSLDAPTRGNIKL